MLKNGWRRVLSSLVVWSAAAATSCARTDEPTQSADQSLGPCADQWWRAPVAGACACSGRPECSAPDCESVSVLWLSSDGSYRSGVVSSSPSTATLGFVGEVSGGSYQSEGGKYRFVPEDGQPYLISQVECSPERLVLNQIVKIPAGDAMTSAMDAALGAQR